MVPHHVEGFVRIHPGLKEKKTVFHRKDEVLTCETGSLQTMRWGHAHPTWTYWALPFLGRWLRRNFRDETLPATGKAIALRVVEIPEEEAPWVAQRMGVT